MLESVAEHEWAYDSVLDAGCYTRCATGGRCHDISSIGCSYQGWYEECFVVLCALQLEHSGRGRIPYRRRRYTRDSCRGNAGLATACRGAIGWQYLVPVARYSCRSRSFAVGGPDQNSRHPSNKRLSTNHTPPTPPHHLPRPPSVH